MTPDAALHIALQDRTARVGVIGLGYVGLPLLSAFVNAGFQTIGFDTDRAKVDALLAGRSYIEHVPGEVISQWIHDGAFEPTPPPPPPRRLRPAERGGRPADLRPHPADRRPRPGPELRRGQLRPPSPKTLRPGQLVVLESTTYPGTTRDVMLPILNRSGLAAGEDYFLAYSPEREDPGNPDYDRRRASPRSSAGWTRSAGSLARLLYEAAVVRIVPVGSPEVAEACKILENTYRAVNIALVNELKVLLDRMDVDVWEVIDAAKTKPFGFQAFYPGPGLGGHCIPIDPFYLTWLARRQGLNTRFIELAGEVNTSMPEYVVGKVVGGAERRREAGAGQQDLRAGAGI